jgi:hypothetical protein
MQSSARTSEAQRFKSHRTTAATLLMPVCQLIINNRIRRRVRALPKDCATPSPRPAGPSGHSRQKPAAASDAAHLSHAVVHLMFGKGFPLQHRRGVEDGSM